MIKRLIEETIPIIEYICTGYKEHHFCNFSDGLGKFTNWGGADSSHFGINMAIFEKIFYDLSKKGLISIDNKGNPNDENDHPIKDEMDIDYRILDLKGLEKYLLDIKTAYPRRKEPLIHKKTLELIARDIGEMDNGINLVEFLKDCGVEAELIIYPNTKWKMIYDILEYFAYSDKPEDKENIFKIVEGAIHPLMHNGDEDVAKKYENRFNSLLKYDGYILRDYKIDKIIKNEDTKGKDTLENKEGSIERGVLGEKQQAKIIEFKQQAAPTSDGKSISMPSLERSDVFKVNEKALKKEREKRDKEYNKLKKEFLNIKEESFDPSLWWILKEVSKTLNLQDSDMMKFIIKLPPCDDKEIPLPNEQWKALYRLKKIGIIDIKQDDPEIIIHNSLYNVVPTKYLLIVNRKSFDNIYEKYEEFCATNDKLQYFQEKIKKEIREETKQKNDIVKKAVNCKNDNRKEKIESIIFIQHKKEEQPYKFLINKDYKNTKTIRKDSRSMKTLVSVISGDSVKYDRSIADYFNTNINCPLYFKGKQNTNGKYKLTTILENSDGYFEINKEIKGDIITDRSFKRYKNKVTT